MMYKCIVLANKTGMFNTPLLPSTRESKLLEQLRENPQLFDRFESILALAREDDGTEVRSADEVEFALIEQLRQLGNETLTHWAGSAEEKVSKELKTNTDSIQQREKKTLKWWSTYGLIEVEERLWRSNCQSYIRVLPEAIGVSQRGRSLALERVLSDFGLEKSFSQAAVSVKEHYGFEISPSTVSRTSIKHASGIGQQQSARPAVRTLPAQGAERIITESDGSFVRIVTTDPDQEDSRKSRTVDFQEARLCAATGQGSDSVCYEATFRDVDSPGWLWAQCAKEAGWALNSEIHVVGDGASRISKQAENVFGGQGSYLVDFYHVCEYLASAASFCSVDPKSWMNVQKERLKSGQCDPVIAALESSLEAEDVLEENAPVRRAHRYLSKRKEQLNYALALSKELPIGFGLIESAHKHVIQQRLKLPGAAWSIQHAEAMVQARAFRANGFWEDYWTKQRDDKVAA